MVSFGLLKVYQSPSVPSNTACPSLQKNESLIDPFAGGVLVMSMTLVLGVLDDLGGFDAFARTPNFAYSEEHV